MPGPADYLSASDGTGEAVRAIVTTTRGVGVMTLITDSVAKWPVKFVATSGTLDETTGLIDPDTLTVFKGVRTGSIITIEEFAPGYTDIGHEVNQIVVLKPSTFWADLLVEAVLEGGSITIGPTPPPTPDPGDLWGDTNTDAPYAVLAQEIGNVLHPVGSVYMTTNSANPSTYLGFGTWAAWGSGRVPVGVDVGQTEFDTVEETGGAKTHTLVTGEMPSHNHSMGTINRLANVGNVVAGATTFDDWPGSSGPISATDAIVGNSWTGSMGMTGGGGAHNNLQPYITCYMWKRTA
jgi:hypothetical protein